MTKAKNTAKYIEPLHINGMHGRMMYLPPISSQKRDILVIYGHHSSLERWWGLAQNLNDYGAVTMPDLPGFGGMDSFYKIGKQATLDNYADYMAAFIKLRYRRKKVSIIGISFGFLVATRMLQKYPELTGRVDVLVSAMGFMHRDNFKFTPSRHRFYTSAARVFDGALPAKLFRYTALNNRAIRTAYARTNNAKHKFKQAEKNGKKFAAMMDREVELWQQNDVRTYMKTSQELLTVNHCETKIDLPVWHVHTPHDNYFDNDVIEQQMRVVFRDYVPFVLDAKTHAPSVIATKQEAAPFMPPGLRQALKVRAQT